MPTAKEVAEVFLRLSKPELGDAITNLKLQKLVYYAQGFHLALNNGVPLFEEPIYAWEHGPVVPPLYHDYKEFGANPLPVPEAINAEAFSKEQIELIDEINDVYGQFSAWKLRDLTHSEKPWIETPKDEVISHHKLLEFFASQINRENS